jgi:hypothetical protein
MDWIEAGVSKIVSIFLAIQHPQQQENQQKQTQCEE